MRQKDAVELSGKVNAAYRALNRYMETSYFVVNPAIEIEEAGTIGLGEMRVAFDRESGRMALRLSLSGLHLLIEPNQLLVASESVPNVYLQVPRPERLTVAFVKELLASLPTDPFLYEPVILPDLELMLQPDVDRLFAGLPPSRVVADGDEDMGVTRGEGAFARAETDRGADAEPVVWLQFELDDHQVQVGIDPHSHLVKAMKWKSDSGEVGLPRGFPMIAAFVIDGLAEPLNPDEQPQDNPLTFETKNRRRIDDVAAYQKILRDAIQKEYSSGEIEAALQEARDVLEVVGKIDPEQTTPDQVWKRVWAQYVIARLEPWIAD